MIIINAEDVDNYIKELYYIKNEYALIILIIIYIEDKNILINKKILMNHLNIPVFFVNNINEIKDFIISQENCDSVRLFIDSSSKMIDGLQKIKALNNFFHQNIDEDKYSEQ